MQICEYLEIRYLWIDSLCIMQDSTGDWRRNAATMYDVYEHSEVVLSALDAANSDNGLFLDRIFAERLWPTYMHASASRWQKSLTLTECLLSQEDMLYEHFEVSPRKNWVAGELELGILLTRAWELQERMAARRKIFFGRNQLFWECCRHTLGEAGRLRVENKYNNSARLVPWLQSLPRDLVPAWHTIVEHYTSCGLTEPKNRLVAISGITQAFQLLSLTGGYLAGLWSTSIVEDLTWYQTSIQSTPGNAPSWSWASVKEGGRGVLFCKLTELIDAEIQAARAAVSLHPESDSEHLFGEVTSGSLRIRGPLHPIKVVSGPISSRALRLRGKSYDIDVLTWIPTTDPTGDPNEFPHGLGWKSHRLKWITELVGVWIGEENWQFWLLSLYRDFGRFSRITCLVLVRAGDSQGVYRRVGLAQVGGANDSRGRRRRLLSQAHQLPANMTANSSIGKGHKILLV
jgi:Heterokaryon incompatibility protein (HET)